MKTNGNTILITGATSGIGLALAERLSQEGNKVVVSGRRQHLLDRIAVANPDLDVLQLDVTDPHSITEARDHLASRYPDLNVVVNNAGVMMKEDLLDPAGLDAAESQVLTNLLGTIRMTYAFLPLLQGKTNAVLVNVSSALAFVPYSTTPTYSATKAAVHSFTDGLRAQLGTAGSSIQVIELIPPGVRTTLLGQQDDEHAMPLDDFIDETLDALRLHPDARELVVERARPLRDAVSNGTYDDMVGMLSGA